MAAAGDRAMSAATGPRPSLTQLQALCDDWFIQSPGMGIDLNADGKVNFTDYAVLAKSGFILVVEGAIPIGSSGKFCEIGSDMTMIDAMGKFGAAASQIIAVGACASFGGIPAATPNPTQALSVKGALAHLGITKPVINIAGCPIHPDWLVGTISSILVNGTPGTLDANGRPTAFFGALVHDTLSQLEHLQFHLCPADRPRGRPELSDVPFARRFPRGEPAQPGRGRMSLRSGLQRQTDILRLSDKEMEQSREGSGRRQLVRPVRRSLHRLHRAEFPGRDVAILHVERPWSR